MLDAESPQGHGAAGRIRYIEKLFTCLKILVVVVHSLYPRTLPPQIPVVIRTRLEFIYGIFKKNTFITIFKAKSTIYC
jgi:hypothetical protein